MNLQSGLWSQSRNVRLLSNYTVKAMPRKGKKDAQINFWLTGEDLAKPNSQEQIPVDSAGTERWVWVLCSSRNYFHKILGQSEGDQRRNWPVSLCLGSGGSAQYWCPRYVSDHPSLLLRQQGLKTARDTNPWPLKFQKITQEKVSLWMLYIQVSRSSRGLHPSQLTWTFNPNTGATVPPEITSWRSETTY